MYKLTIKNKINYLIYAYYASTNTRLKGFENPFVVDNKKDIENIINTFTKTDLIDYFKIINCKEQLVNGNFINF